jgi:hypothetical protein
VPEVAPGITIATSVVPVLDTAMAETPPIVKAVGLFRLVPVIVTNDPILPVVGVKEVMVCANALLSSNKQLTITAKMR